MGVGRRGGGPGGGRGGGGGGSGRTTGKQSAAMDINANTAAPAGRPDSGGTRCWELPRRRGRLGWGRCLRPQHLPRGASSAAAGRGRRSEEAGASLGAPGLRGIPPGSPRRRVSPSPGPCRLLSLRAFPGAPADSGSRNRPGMEGGAARARRAQHGPRPLASFGHRPALVTNFAQVSGARTAAPLSARWPRSRLPREPRAGVLLSGVLGLRLEQRI